MSTSITKNQAGETYVISCSSESSYNIPYFGSRDSVLFKNASATDMTLNCQGTDTVDGATSLALKGYASVELIRGLTEWVAIRSYDKRDESSENFTVAGTLTVTGASYLNGDLTMDEDTARLGQIGELPNLDTTTAVGSAFTNQPANDGIEVGSSDAGDTTQTVTIIGTTTGTDTVVVETVTLTGTTFVSTVKTDWGVVLAVKKSAATLGTVTVREASGNATITAGLTAAVLSVGVTSVAAADQDAYGRLLRIVADGATTKQIGIKGTDTSDVVQYDSQALNGSTEVNSNLSFRTITEIYRGDLEVARTVTVDTTDEVRLNGAKIGYKVSASGVGSAYALTNVAAAVDFGTTDPAIVLDKAGTYNIRAQVNLAYNGATVAAETCTIKVRRTNNTAADLSEVVVLDLPVATTLTHTYGIFQIPEFQYTTTATDDAITIFANVSAALGAGTIDATAIGTSIIASRVY